MGAAEAFTLSHEIKKVGFLLIGEGQFATGEEVNSVIVAEIGGCKERDIFRMIDFECAGLQRQLLEESDGRVNGVAVPEAVRGCHVQDSPRRCQGRERTKQQEESEPGEPAVHEFSIAGTALADGNGEYAAERFTEVTAGSGPAIWPTPVGGIWSFVYS